MGKYRKYAEIPLKQLPNRVWRSYCGGAMIDRWKNSPSCEDGDMPEEWVASTVVARGDNRPENEGVSVFMLPDGGTVPMTELIAGDEEAFLGEVMHYGAATSVRLDWPVLAGCLAGCLFACWWMHVRRLPYVRLIVVGLAGVGGYLLGLYFIISKDIALSQLYVPMACRGFGYAVLSVVFMTCLEEVMSFQHFFQTLSVFNMLHMVVGGVMGAALYTQGLHYYVADNLARYGAAVDSVAVGTLPVGLPRYMETFMQAVTAVSIKQLYGWAAYACCALLLLFLLYDSPLRRDTKLMPAWQQVRRQVAVSLPGRKRGRVMRIFRRHP